MPLLHAISSVAGIHVPAFVERAGSVPRRSRRSGVAGIHVPAFVERRRASPSTAPLSGVAGIHVPAFVERSTATTRPTWATSVSPGFTSRPSLSGERQVGRHDGRARVSPGFTSRPSLSGVARLFWSVPTGGVAGIHVPAFVERSRTGWRRIGCPCVAGIHVPAFVERASSCLLAAFPARVSPGFTSRPSLSDRPTGAVGKPLSTCRRDSRSGLR